MHKGHWQGSLREHRPDLKDIGIIASAGILLGILGPFGTYEKDLTTSLTFWLCTCLAGYAVYLPFMIIAGVIAGAKNIPILLGYVFMSPFAAIPMTFVVQLANIIIFHDDAPNNPDDFLNLYPLVLVIGLTVTAASQVRNEFTRRTKKVLERAKTPHSAELPEPGRLFLDRLPPALGRDLICIGMEDHYLRVYTEKGEHMLLHRMKDAISELEDYDGLQVHRSWWVANRSVKNLERDGRKLSLVMSNGLVIPVSRSFQAMVREQFPPGKYEKISLDKKAESTEI
ncbi:LytTR family DNA-binding domain-containing protein [Emcibacter sp.]|uniref:LytTR family DNA-binding domain-containing protein n=1 Tax=Emcibacter sp. TaxID=1979954 RepID=UPI003A9419F7